MFNQDLPVDDSGLRHLPNDVRSPPLRRYDDHIRRMFQQVVAEPDLLAGAGHECSSLVYV
jgi:hypothetical protein